MNLSIRNNVTALGVQRHIMQSTNALSGVMSRLASGQRITVAADDAAGLGISERMRSQVRSMRVARRNVLDGVSMLQSADGALTETADRIHRIRELAMQSANGTLTDSDRQVLDNERAEVAALTLNELNNFQFNGITLFTGTDSVTVQAGITGDADSTVEVQLVEAARIGLIMSITNISTQSGAEATLDIMDVTLDFLTEEKARYGAGIRRLESIHRSLFTSEENLTAAESRIRDADVATETALFARHSILQQTGVAVLSQANLAPELALTLLRP